jgi:hypothetical protein
MFPTLIVDVLSCSYHHGILQAAQSAVRSSSSSSIECFINKEILRAYRRSQGALTTKKSEENNCKQKNQQK